MRWPAGLRAGAYAAAATDAHRQSAGGCRLCARAAAGRWQLRVSAVAGQRCVQEEKKAFARGLQSFFQSASVKLQRRCNTTVQRQAHLRLAFKQLAILSGLGVAWQQAHNIGFVLQLMTVLILVMLPFLKDEAWVILRPLLLKWLLLVPQMVLHFLCALLGVLLTLTTTSVPISLVHHLSQTCLLGAAVAWLGLLPLQHVLLPLASGASLVVQSWCQSRSCIDLNTSEVERLLEEHPDADVSQLPMLPVLSDLWHPKVRRPDPSYDYSWAELVVVFLYSNQLRSTLSRAMLDRFELKGYMLALFFVCPFSIVKALRIFPTAPSAVPAASLPPSGTTATQHFDPGPSSHGADDLLL